MKVLVVGAGGTLGLPLVRRLLAAGHDVDGITRSKSSATAVTAAGARARRRSTRSTGPSSRSGSARRSQR